MYPLDDPYRGHFSVLTIVKVTFLAYLWDILRGDASLALGKNGLKHYWNLIKCATNCIIDVVINITLKRAEMSLSLSHSPTWCSGTYGSISLECDVAAVGFLISLKNFKMPALSLLFDREYLDSVKDPSSFTHHPLPCHHSRNKSP